MRQTMYLDRRVSCIALTLTVGTRVTEAARMRLA